MKLFCSLAAVAIAIPLFACTAVDDGSAASTDDLTDGDGGAACSLAVPENTFCPAVYEPVCGCDGMTYGNSCEASRAVTSSSPGACADGGATDGGVCKLAKPENTFCPAVYDPVCGCDGKTYGNSCEAGRAVTSSSPGACADGGATDGGVCKLATPENTFCPAVYEPVCGCDGNTYGNSCEAARVVTSSTPGACN